MKCPNINTQAWKDLVNKIGVFEAFKEYRNNNFEIPDASNYEETFKGVNATMKIVDALQRLQRKSYPSNNVQGFYNDLVKLGAPKNQIDLLRSHIESKSITDISIPDLIISLLSEMSYTVTVKTAKETQTLQGFDESDKEIIESNTGYYSNLTVPGGTNYTENEIAIPGVEVEERPQGTEVKEGVDFVFEQSPELTSIGTPAQYSQYLDTIFPDSKVKDIVYHGTDTRFESFDKNKISSKESTAHAKGFYFGWAGKFGAAASYAGNFGRGKEKVLLANTVQIQNPFILNGSFAPIKENQQFVDFLIRNGFDITKWKHYPKGDIFDYTTSVGTDKITEALKREGYDSIIVNKGGWKTIKRNVELGDVQANSDELIVFEPEQIHILGNKQDINNFKEFIKDNTKTVRKGAITPSIKGHAQFATDNGIGWFRSDDKDTVKRKPATNINEVPDTFTGVNNYTITKTKEGWLIKHPDQQDQLETSEKEIIEIYNYGSQEYSKDSKTRRILEVQSDWGQKQRKSAEPDINIKYDIQQIINDLQKSGDLKIDCN